MWSLSCILNPPRFARTLAARSLLIAFVMAAGSAAAEPLQTPEQSEEAALRQELERIVKGDPERAADARQKLEALDKPATSRAGRALRSRRKKGAKRVVNGVATFGYSAVAAILKGSDPNGAEPHCTGTLVGCDKVLTAAHCFDKDRKHESYVVYFQNLGFVKVKDIKINDDEYDFPYADLAVLTLAKPVEGIAPISINTSASPINESIATIVGYGRTGAYRQDYGIKQEGSVKFGACLPADADKKLLCWNFDADIKTHTKGSNTCEGDSGGGLFVLDKQGRRRVQRVVGVVSGGRDEGCVKDDYSFNTDVFLWRDWITKAAQGGLSNRRCGEGPRVDAPRNLKTMPVAVGPAEPGQTFNLEVPEGITSLRVAMNGVDKTDDGELSDFDLLVFEGTAPAAVMVADAAKRAAIKPACEQTGEGQFAFCEIPDPKSGQWTIVLRRKEGEGKAQISVTMVRGRSTQAVSAGNGRKAKGR